MRDAARSDSTDSKALSGLLFDVDGVLLVDTATDPRINREAARIALERCGVADDSGSIWETLATARSNEAFAEVLSSVEVDPETLWRYREQAANRLGRESLQSGARPAYHDVEEVKQLAADHPVGLASNNRHATVQAVAEHLFDGLVEVAVGRQPTFEDYQRRKPKPTFLERALEELSNPDSIGKHTIGYVGDRQKDIIAARRAGLTPVFIRRPHNLHIPLDPRPVFEIESLADLADLMAE